MNKKIGKVIIYLMFIALIVTAVVGILKLTKAPDPTIVDFMEFFEDGKVVECEYNVYLETIYVKTVDKKEYSLSGINYDFFKNEIYDPYIKGKAQGEVPDTETAVPGTSTVVPGTSTVVPGTSTVVPGTSTAVPGTDTEAPGTQEQISGIKFKFTEPKTTPSWVMYVGMFLVIAVVIGLVVYMAKQGAKGNGGSGGGPGGRSFGKVRAKNALDMKNKVYFKDVAGCDEEKAELQEIVEYLRNPEKFTKLGAKIPRGVLLVGPPGTGKTLLSKAVAGEAGVPFYSISGSDFVELYVGVGASRVRDLFDTARKHPASIIFIDEIDAVGRHRGAGLGGGHDEREQTLNQLLVEMDGFSGAEGTIVMAATNRPDILDPALLRPGRFDRQVTVNYPDMKGREEILKVHSRKKPLEETVDLRKIAQITVGMTGADLANVLNEAALLAARKGKSLIGMNDIEEATMKVVVGTPKKSYKIGEKERRNTAIHEAGHALLDYYLPTQDPVRQISIVPSSKGALGYTLSPPSEDKYSEYKRELEERIAVLLGGRVAETITYGDYTGGASSDISRATSIAKKMVTRLGMSDLGPIAFGSGHSESEVFLGRDFSSSKDYSEDTASKIDREIKKIIDRAYKLAEDTIREHNDKLNFVADFLVEYEVMDADQFRAAMESPCPNAEEIYAMAEDKRRISEEENERKREQDEKDRLAREKYLRENDENYDETDVNKGRFEKENGDDDDDDNSADNGGDGNDTPDSMNNDGEVPH